jgi:phosphoesterase RecJ-like protein
MTALLTPEEAAAFLRAGNNYLLLSHRRPDGDTTGSCAALCLALRALGKQAWVYPNPQFTPRFAPYLEGLLFEATGDGGTDCHDQSADWSRNDRIESDPQTFNFQLSTFNLISCDVASRSLLPFGMEDAEVALSIDHHGGPGFAARTLVDPEAAACGELLTEFLPLLGVALDRPMAEALYVAISTDTGCFRYSNVTAATFRAAAACAAAGADMFPINRAFFEIKRRPRLALEAYLIRTMEYFADGRVAVSAIPEALMEELGLTEDDVDDISGFGRSIEGVELAVMLREVEDGKGKISLRTAPGFNAAAICARLGGGGHPGAAGASVEGGIPAAREAILKAISEEIEL